ncbi:peroxisomal membrane protein 2, pxmp2 [Aspergillus nomiae NRRL 13137]|uniref:Peroxisomal membrane protein 2, pxmp2 n=1 Tax=Aspergillus nomiae NRRL (strain ATCC 15546 / NRRL 13137 / CBS 260.88 / M93) TaxID=1509407 RepID=A0A0L1IWG1_ASPN3|nr:peroxisomal membrane protein 2, pxmp2 [Aspergillus nomiae NRRL 13137]KNG83832.1 peroxisomal membrane protein 2, pxmp2 [Aspergillus nomiae NRRL 13137]
MARYTKAIVQSAILKSAANLTAQLFRYSTNPTAQPLDWKAVVEFAIFGLIQAQVNCHWQEFLEDVFPSYSAADKTTALQETIQWRNIVYKIILDQTIGLFIMNTIFLVCTNFTRLTSASVLLAEVNRKVWPLIVNAWKVWPACSLCNFLWVPVESRVFVASCVGFGWNIFLAFFTMVK